jgi:hypothetical protein
MLDKVDLTQSFPKKKFKKLLPRLQRRLYDLEKACWDHKIASIILLRAGTRRAKAPPSPR